MLRKWEDLPEFMRIPEVRPYWDILDSKRGQILLKRLFDIIGALVLIAVLAVPMLIISIMIKTDTAGDVFFRQERVTAYGERFRIHKFRTMVSDAEIIGPLVTGNGDERITKVGAKLRHMRLDELPQLFDILSGSMSFVGTRPEAVRFVEKYQPQYYATLLMPAGVTSETSIMYKDEELLINSSDDPDNTYLKKVLPEKMKWNLNSIECFSLKNDFATMIKTVAAVSGKEHS